MGEPGHPYYYAGGVRVALERDQDVAASDLAGLPAADAAAWQRLGQPLAGHLVLLPRGAAPPVRRGAAPAVVPRQLPVYRSEGARLVALPEVRVEDEDPAALGRVRDWLASRPDAGEVVAERPGRLTLRAGDALACDGVALAREAVERCGVASASPRFVRVVRKAG